MPPHRSSARGDSLRLLTERLLAPVAASCLFLMMAMTFVEVIARYFLGTPLTGVEEIKSFLLGFTVFTALPLVTRQQRHIAVRSLANLLRGRTLYVQRALVLGGTAVGLGFLSFLLWDQAGALARDGTLTNFLDLPVAPPIYVFAVLVLCAAIVALERLAALVIAGAEEEEAPAEAAGPE